MEFSEVEPISNWCFHVYNRNRLSNEKKKVSQYDFCCNKNDLQEQVHFNVFVVLFRAVVKQQI